MQGACSDLSSTSPNPLSRSPNLHILHYNARSLYPKFDELCAICDIEKPDVVCITETWFCNDIAETECTIHGYKCVRCDRN